MSKATLQPKSKSENRLSRELINFAKHEFLNLIKFHTGKELAVKSDILVHTINTHYGLKISTGVLRDMINYCRANGYVKNLVGNNQGYWIEPFQKERDKYVKTLHSRVREIGKIIKSIDTSFDCDQLGLF